MGAAGSIFSSIGGIFTGLSMDQEEAAAGAQQEYQTHAAMANAKMARDAARSARDRGSQQQMASRMKYGALRGEQATAIGASGISVNSGSAADILTNTKAMSDYDAAVIHNNAAREAWSYDTQAAQYREQVQMLGRAGNARQTATLLKQVGNTVGTVGSAAGSFGGS
jgi:Na+-translocating ferredoxin:NAD+ oxidoreductase RnfC subunit